jgi:tetratricopeptide (TPR) repeat protein
MLMNNRPTVVTVPIWLPTLMLIFISARAIAYFADRSQVKENVGITWLEPGTDDLEGKRSLSKLVLYEFSSELNNLSRTIDTTTLLRNGVVKLTNEQFVPVRVVEKKPNKDSNEDDIASQLRQKFRVESYPTFLVTLPDGKEIDRSLFPASAQSFIAFLRHSQRLAEFTEGIELLSSAKYQLSAKAFEDWLAHTETSKNDMANAALYCSLSYYMLGENEKAKMVLEPALAKYQCADPIRWPEPIANFMLGKITSDALLKQCSNHKDKRHREARAHYFIGMKKLKQGNIAGSKEDFLLAKTNAYESSETYYLANGLLDKNGKQRN